MRYLGGRPDGGTMVQLTLADLDEMCMWLEAFARESGGATSELADKLVLVRGAEEGRLILPLDIPPL